MVILLGVFSLVSRPSACPNLLVTSVCSRVKHQPCASESLGVRLACISILVQYMW